MAIHKLTPAFVQKVTKKGVYGDGGGLYLRVDDAGSSKSWQFRFARSRFGGVGGASMGLGSTHTVGLNEARELARQYRQQLLEGVDPLEAKRSAEAAAKLEAAKNVTFQSCAEDYLAFKDPSWRQATRDNATFLLQRHVYPKLKNMLIGAIDHIRLAQVLNPVFDKTPVSASQTRILLEAIFSRATAKGLRVGDNPASLKGPLGVLLPRLSDRHTVEHHKSMPYLEVPAFMAELQSFKSVKTAGWMAAQVIQFTILTAVRTGETFGMRWAEIDWENRTWTVPWQRIKTGKKTKNDHLVPLSEAALKILRTMRDLQKQCQLELDYVFVRNLLLPGRPLYYQKRRLLRQRELANVPLSGKAPSVLLKRTLKQTVTLHGFRTSFSSWANDLGRDRDAIEMSLGHDVGAEVERIYARNATRLVRRRALMEEWGEYCSRTGPLPSAVIPFKQAR